MSSDDATAQVDASIVLCLLWFEYTSNALISLETFAEAVRAGPKLQSSMHYRRILGEAPGHQMLRAF